VSDSYVHSLKRLIVTVVLRVFLSNTCKIYEYYLIKEMSISEAIIGASSKHMGLHSGYLDGPRSNPDRDEIFRPSRPALWPTQPPVKCVPVSPGGKVRPGCAADHSPPSSAAVMEE